MAKHLVMDSFGHTTIEFDRADPKMLAEAEARFMELVHEHKHTAATRQAGASEYKQIKSPDQEQDETLFVPQMRGG